MMKKLLLLTLSIATGFSLYSQKPQLPENWRSLSVEMEKAQPTRGLGENTSSVVMSPTRTALDVNEESIGISQYDLQTNTAIENRVFRHDDGTMAAVWTMGLDGAPSFPGRGTGYNYFDGSSWGEHPGERVENERCGWPNYSSLGDDGEIIISHTGIELKISTRENKGMGDWDYSTHDGPEGYDLIWPRMTTIDNTIHLVGNLPNETNGGTIYEGLDGAITYSRSTDGGETWVDDNILLPGMTSDEYIGFTADSYTWASNGSTIALVVASNWYGHDLFYLKSEDNGETWAKTVVWENPYNMETYEDIITEDTLWAPDGSIGCDIDSEGNVHIAFGLSWVLKEETGPESGYNYFPFAEGIVYWNETMDPFIDEENQHEALSYDNLVEDETLVGWLPDVNGNGEIDIETTEEMYAYRTIGSSTMPSLTINDNNDVFLFYSTMREDLFSGTYYYRHVYARAKSGSSNNWIGDPFDVTGGDLHFFDECIFPQAANMLPGDDMIYVMYMKDNAPGLAFSEDHDWVDNTMVMAEVAVFDVSNEDNLNTISNNMVSQNFPNPFKNLSSVKVKLAEDANLKLEVINQVGQTVRCIDEGFTKKGVHTLQIDGRNLKPGMYIYKVIINEEIITNKMLVE